jgi:SAM-dependent methyltransferase
MNTAPSDNQPQVDYWNGDAGKTWAKKQSVLDANMAILSEAALAFASAKPGEHVMDVGCGAGDTTLALARTITASGAKGRILGVDVSEPMLERARERGRESGLEEGALAFLRADAATHAFEPGSFDLLFSRFGVMFFADPVRAFTNLRRAARGRLAFMCWRAFEENPWSRAPLEVGLPFLPPQPPADPHAPGPFAFAEEARVKSILDAAGWRDVTMTPVDRDMSLGTSATDAAEFVLGIGPLARALREANDPDATAKVREKLVTMLAGHEKNGAIALSAAVWLVGARA